MRAIEITAPGPADVLRLTERPSPPMGPGEVRIAIAAAALHERHLAIGEPRPDRERPDEVVPLT